MKRTTHARRRGTVFYLKLAASFIAFALLIAGWQGLKHLQAIARLASCRPNLQLRTAEAYATENEGLYPPLSPVYGRFTYDTDLCGEYTYSVSDHICEFDKEGPTRSDLRESHDPRYIDDWSYLYLGYFIENESQGLAFVEAYRKVIEEQGTFGQDLKVPMGDGNAGGDVLYRLRSGTALPEELAHIQDRLEQIPIVVEWPGNHGKYGAKVIYLDGHQEVLPYPGKFPMTEKFIGALRELDESAGPYHPDL